MRTLNNYHLQVRNLSTTKGVIWKSQRRFKY